MLKMIKNIDAYCMFTAVPPAIDYVLPNMFAGGVGSLVSPGGAGKSMMALQLAVQISGGSDLLSMGPLATGPVVYLPAEDPPLAIHHRMFSIGSRLNDEQRHAVAAQLTIKSLLGKGPDLMDPSWHADIKQIAGGARLLILDTLRRFHVEDENSSSAMAQLIGKMEEIAAETGCAILFLHHSSKSSALAGLGDQQQAGRGSSVLTDNIRWQSYLVGMTSEEASKYNVADSDRGAYVRFGISKANFGPRFPEKWFRREDGGVLRPVDLYARPSRRGLSSREAA